MAYARLNYGKPSNNPDWAGGLSFLSIDRRLAMGAFDGVDQDWDLATSRGAESELRGLSEPDFGELSYERRYVEA